MHNARHSLCRLILAAGALLVIAPGVTATAQPRNQVAPSASPLPTVTWRPASLLMMPGVNSPDYNAHQIDSNSPVSWNGNTLYLFNSWLHPWRASGPDLMHVSDHIPVYMGKVNDRLYTWIESTYMGDGGMLYGAYHYEPDNLCRANHHLPTAPKIGWMRSVDNGKTWTSLGFVLADNPAGIQCAAKSIWDVGGEGDFSVIPDRNKQYFYFFFTSYDKDFSEQGIGLARMRYSDRDNPAGKVWKWYHGAFSSPGIGGPFTPVFPARKDWDGGHADLFWGPSISWNSYLNTYVILLNHAIDSNMTQGGIYITFNAHLANPSGWSKPQMILNRDQILQASRGLPVDQSMGWYPELIGMRNGESDKLCGQTGRFFMEGMSRMEIVFHKPGETNK